MNGWPLQPISLPTKMNKVAQWFPVLAQVASYSKGKWLSDVIAAVVVTVMLVPQSLAYAMLAGLPPHYGLYASIIPIVIYSLLGSSTSLAVGPVAIASIMTASALSSVVSTGLVSYVDGAITLAFLSGAMLFLLGVFRFGFVANFLSHSVVSGFITASGLIIALGQLKHLMGVSVSGHTFFELAHQLVQSVSSINHATISIGIACLLFFGLGSSICRKRLGDAWLAEKYGLDRGKNVSRSGCVYLNGGCRDIVLRSIGSRYCR